MVIGGKFAGKNSYKHSGIGNALGTTSEKGFPVLGDKHIKFFQLAMTLLGKRKNYTWKIWTMVFGWTTK